VGLLAFSVGQFVCHSISILIHEASHQLILKKARGTMLVLFFIELGTLSFAHSTGYVARHGISHHQCLNDYSGDYEFWDRCMVAQFHAKPLWRLFEGVLHLLPAGPIVGEVLMDSLGKYDDDRHLERRRFVSKGFKTFLQFTSLSLYGLAWVFLGWGAALYLLWSLSIMMGNWGISLQGQTIAEHGIEGNGKTFSNYSFWDNLFFLNIGYHDEHHTFPQVPWVYLPTVRKIAPEYFQNSSGRSFLGWWWNWVASGFQPETFHRYRPEAIDKPSEKLEAASDLPS
jgi:sphingolipid delta-4 desaturase